MGVNDHINNSIMSNKSNKVTAPSQISREFIECDSCGKSDPRKRCGQCLTAYYCSQECQRQDWKNVHKQRCVPMGEHRKRCEAHGKDVPDSKMAGIITEGPCVICLEETITSPVVLDCSHVFCYKCLDKYQQTRVTKFLTERGADVNSLGAMGRSSLLSAGSLLGDPNIKSKCPYCREEMPDLRMEAVKRSTLYGERMFKLPFGSDERKKCLELAVSGLDAILKSDKGDLIALKCKAKLLIEDDPETAVSILEKILLIVEQTFNKTVFNYWDTVFDIKLHLAKAYQSLEEWKKSINVYTSILGHSICGHEILYEVRMGMSRNFYEIGAYEKSIKCGNSAIETCRVNKRVHKYVALSQKAKGDIDGAKKTLSRAVLYEEPWDEENLKDNLQMLNEL